MDLGTDDRDFFLKASVTGYPEMLEYCSAETWPFQHICNSLVIISSAEMVSVLPSKMELLMRLSVLPGFSRPV